jgi:hypothetical protein
MFRAKPQRKSPLGRPTRRWKDNVKLGHKEITYESGDWVERAQDRTVTFSYEHVNEPSGSIKCVNGGATVGFSRTRFHLVSYTEYLVAQPKGSVPAIWKAITEHAMILM